MEDLLDRLAPTLLIEESTPSDYYRSFDAVYDWGSALVIPFDARTYVDGLWSVLYGLSLPELQVSTLEVSVIEPVECPFAFPLHFFVLLGATAGLFLLLARLARQRRPPEEIAIERRVAKEAIPIAPEKDSDKVAV